MAIKNERIIVGNVGRVYELRKVGKDDRSVVDFSVACTPRRRNADTQEWEDGDTIWSNCTAWGTLADNIAETWNPGDPVIIVGRTEMKSGYTNKEGEEVPPREVVILEFGGHENSRYSSTVNKDSSSKAPAAKKAAPAAKPAPAKKAVAPADDELTLDDDFDGDDDLPF